MVAAACPVAASARERLARANGQVRREHISEYCNGCKPPLRYFGGPLLDTHGPQGVTVTPIYWAPPGAANEFPPNYEAVINGYISNVAAASGVDTNVYSIDTEYYDVFGSQPSYASYRITAGSPVVDTRPLPKNGCKPSSEFQICITDQQLVAELDAVLTARHLPRGLAHFYPVFFPPSVETDDGTGSRSPSGFCAYHSIAGSRPRQIVYGNEPYLPDGCGSGQAPNGSLAVDGAIDVLSHEVNESITDPADRTAWQDASGAEVGDICTTDFATPLGSTDPNSSQTTEYNQVINGGHYYTQTEFSNYAYHRFGVGMGCQPSESAARGPSATGSGTHIYSNPTRHTLPANGRRTSSIFVQVWDKDGYDIPDDRIFFTSYVLSGRGTCGTVRPRSAYTDGAGTVSVTYHASRSNVACVIVATDAMGGNSVSTVIYQGRKRSIAPRAHGTFPRKVTAGRKATFTTSFVNPMRSPIRDAQPQLWIFAPGVSSPNVRAGQIHLSVSRHGRHGPFVPVALTGSTVGQAGISGVIGGPTGFEIRGRRTRTLTWRIKVSKRVPRHRRRAILQFEAFLDQVNPGSGADTVLADTGGKNVKVR
jgi:hypothetical protein